jgi:hypothetical protein
MASVLPLCQEALQRDTITDSQLDAILTSSVISTYDRGHLR